MSCDDIEYAWKQFDSLQSDKKENNYNIKQFENEQKIVSVSQHLCKNCKTDTLITSNSEIICNKCGLIQSYILSQQPIFYNTATETPLKSFNSKNSKVLQIHEWKMWSNDEKNAYKLTVYTKSLCNRLEIPDAICNQVFQNVNKIMNAIKQTDGTKRARVKDGIILVCIEYVAKNCGFNNISAVGLSRKMNLDIKYVTKAEKMVLELLNKDKLDIDKNNMLSIESPYNYVQDVINRKNLKIDLNILKAVRRLINFCEENDLLLDHTPLSIGVCCFYYVISMYSYEIDMKIFSELYNLSIVTITKTTNKLKMYDNIIQKQLTVSN